MLILTIAFAKQNVSSFHEQNYRHFLYQISNTEHFRDYETVFIVPGPSCHSQNRKRTYACINILQLN